jgi:hypothetical protein
VGCLIGGYYRGCRIKTQGIGLNLLTD